MEGHLIPNPWRCNVTGNPVGSDTLMLGKPCECQGCRACDEIGRLSKELHRLRAENAEFRKELFCDAVDADTEMLADFRKQFVAAFEQNAGKI
jgi:hypothetical protein